MTTSWGGPRKHSGRPRKPLSEKIRSETYSLDPKTIAWVLAQADLLEISRSKFVRDLLQRAQLNQIRGAIHGN